MVNSLQHVCERSAIVRFR